jgi:hypothetical protein
MAEELPCAVFPRVFQREPAAGVARKLQSLDAGAAEIFVQNTDWPFADHVFRPGHREGRNRYPACQRFELNDAECVGAARENKNISGSQMRGERTVLQRT